MILSKRIFIDLEFLWLGRNKRRRSSRLNQGSVEINEVSDKTLLDNTAVSSAPSTLNVQKQHGPTIGKDMASSYTLLVYKEVN